MNRDEFEYAYAKKYLNGDLTPVNDNRDGEGYTDHHIDLCWKIKQIQDDRRRGSRSDAIEALEW